MGDRETSANWSDIQSWAALGLAVMGVVGLLWGRKAGVVFRFKDPVTHKIVCRCSCTVPDPKNPNVSWGDPQTFEERADCGTLNGIGCSGFYGEGKLAGCEKRSVEVKLERVQDDRPVVMG